MKLHTKALRRKPAGKERAKAKDRPPRSWKRKSTTAPADGAEDLDYSLRRQSSVRQHGRSGSGDPRRSLRKSDHNRQ